MKPRPALVVTLAAIACLLFAACSRPEDSDARSPTPKPSPTPRFADPWKAVADWPVPPGPVGDAQRFLLNAPAYQCTTDGEDLHTHQKSHGTFYVVRNEAIAMESIEPYGRNGIITDGKREFVFYRERYGQEPGDASATLVFQLEEASLQSLLDASDEHTPFLGAEKVNGVEAEVYAFVARKNSGLPVWALEGGHARVWVAKDDHRPLKVEWKEDYHLVLKPNETHTSISTRTYTFDPSVKVTLPGS